MQKLVQRNRDKVVDMLNERLTFERSTVRLYDKIIEEMRNSKEPQIARMIDTMQEYRDQEKEHEEWLEEQIRACGADPHAETDHSRLIKTESKGVEEVILKGDGQIPHLFHALLAGELVDNAGWDLLVEIADEADDSKAKREFKKRLHEEEEHLDFMRRAVEKLAFREVLGEEVSMPSAT
jgi:bacterioferritin (cytochrome b1)